MQSQGWVKMNDRCRVRFNETIEHIANSVVGDLHDDEGEYIQGSDNQSIVDLCEFWLEKNMYDCTVGTIAMSYILAAVVRDRVDILLKVKESNEKQKGELGREKETP